MAQQLIKKNKLNGYSKVTPITDFSGVRDNGRTLSEVLKGFNMYFLAFTGDRGTTRILVPMSLRRKGLWISYVLYDNTIVNEWYTGELLDDNSFKKSENWKDGSSVIAEGSVESKLNSLEKRIEALESNLK